MAQKYNLDYVRQQQQRMIRDGVLGPDTPAAPTPPPTSAPAVQPTVAPGPGTPPPPPASTYDRNALSQAIQGIQFGGGSTLYNPTDFIAQHQGDFAQGVTMVGKDKIRLPDGEVLDIGGGINDQTGIGSAWWGSG